MSATDRDVALSLDLASSHGRRLEIIIAYRTQIMRECADRAIEWYHGSLTHDDPHALRAAVMDDPR